MENLTEAGLPEVFIEPVNILRERGFNPIAITDINCIDTICFNTEKEAKMAYKELELNPEKRLISAYWYGKDHFLETIKSVENESTPYSHRVWWLDVK